MKILMLLFLTSCVVHSDNWKKAEKYCADNKGVKYYERNLILDTVYCNNGAMFKINSNDLVKEDEDSDVPSNIPSPENGNGTGVPFGDNV